jgi:hypothetical protein
MMDGILYVRMLPADKAILEERARALRLNASSYARMLLADALAVSQPVPAPRKPAAREVAAN